MSTTVTQSATWNIMWFQVLNGKSNQLSCFWIDLLCEWSIRHSTKHYYNIPPTQQSLKRSRVPQFHNDLLLKRIRWSLGQCDNMTWRVNNTFQPWTGEPFMCITFCSFVYKQLYMEQNYKRVTTTIQMAVATMIELLTYTLWRWQVSLSTDGTV